jgi:peroxiredoxin Q/BCP
MTVYLSEGDPAPSFSLARDGGGTVSLGDFRGRNLVLYFYPKDDTSGCTKQAIGFTEAKGRFDAADTAIVGVSADPVSKHDKFKAKHDLDVILASDEDKQVLEAYGVWVEKSMYGRTFMGIERATFLIDRDGRIAHIWRKVKVPGHIDEVLEAARALV